MAESITIKRKCRGDDGHKVISVRMKNDLITHLDELAERSNRSRNDVINLLLESAVNNVTIQ